MGQTYESYEDVMLSDRRASHWLDDERYESDDSDYTEFDCKGERLLHEHIVNFSKERSAQHGLSVPRDGRNLFEVYYSFHRLTIESVCDVHVRVC
jgi:hypothetical protein